MKTLRLSVWMASLFYAGVSLAADPQLISTRIAEADAMTDPAASFWKGAAEVAVPLLPQNIVSIKEEKPAITQIQVKSIHNDKWIAFRLSWSDPAPDHIVKGKDFGDQVAVEIPVDPKSKPSPMMGNKGGRVAIFQWRAAFEHDLADGPPEIAKLYPNAHSDLYPDQFLKESDAQSYRGALAVGNGISQAKNSPVLDQMAEGFGSLTINPEQHAMGKGIWKDGQWQVVISHPLNTNSPGDPQLASGLETSVSFAVWEGGHGEVGSKKAWANWVTLKIDP